ncbi:hypothetical protein BY996DRAFT_6432759 [Phakopsora pachyrhizi]|uniref:Mannosyl phosphorylinositol ceramide synthase SUR1 n=1 Tax=Phakopsora pachyrhizi TaxID=170000 RepID=A0AAV0B3Z7_PHAPC|nr:hypothetical protein BY996DRAFT_6432759 [Phakopsora pachyrhizi]CAH7668299.1 hypothetical protein PPACK8108_LOCUS2785 [Phakopsora pachyrhizi]CAH7681268.1 hypothetical protein PPACK8108_LOCUS13853 [Phakopsora pachyrhizi]
MTKPPFSRKFWITLILLLIFALTFWHHIILLTRILLVYPLWSIFSNDSNLSLIKDGLDPTFERYPVRQWSVRWPPTTTSNSSDLANYQLSELLRLNDGSRARLPDEKYHGVSYSDADSEDLVQPILHHILLGMSRKNMPKTWEASRNSCLALHPESANFTHYFWEDHSAENFIRTNYPFFLPDFLGYRHNIQRADALRYFVLHFYGGIFLDLDLECRRSLGPLRRFPVVNINAYPVGISNGFMMAKAGHPFLAQLVQSLKTYDRSWFGIPYLDIMFSTGPMFLSTEHMKFPTSDRSQQLRILGGAEHRLRGKVVTPLFRHLGASSWHQGDVQVILRIRDALSHPVANLLVGCGMFTWLMTWLWLRMSSKGRTRFFWGQHRSNRRLSSPSVHYLSLRPIIQTERFILWGFGLGTNRGRRRINESGGYEAIELELGRNLNGGSRSGSETASLELDDEDSDDLSSSEGFETSFKTPITKVGKKERHSHTESTDDDSSSSTSGSAVVLLVDRQSSWTASKSSKQ